MNKGGKFSRVATLAERQHGVVSRNQLRALGVSDRSIARSIAAGHLHPVFRGVFSVGNRRSDYRARMLAAVLSCGNGAVVSHLTAAALLGLRGRAPLVIDVIAPAESGRSIDGIRRHHVSPPQGAEAGTCNGIPCTSPARTIVDLAGMLGEASLRRLVERAAVLRMLDPSAIESSLRSRRRRGAPLLREILNEWRTIDSTGVTADGTRTSPRLRSELEARLLARIAATDLQPPLCNQRVIAERENVEVDFLWREQRLIVEADGRHFHDNPVAFERDRERDRLLQLAGYRVVRLTHAQIEREPDAVVSAIRRLLAADFG